jgi:outer membrane lipoprotein-sorting protein
MTCRIAALIGLAGVFASLAVSARADDCAVVRAASLAGISRPYAATVKMPGGDGLTVVSHIVMTGQKMYMQMRNIWTTKIVTSKDLIDKANKAALKDAMTCQKSGEEAVDGQSATIYAVEAKDAGHLTHSRIWISNSDGLPLKTEIRMQGGDVMTSVFDYKNVTPPPGAN